MLNLCSTGIHSLPASVGRLMNLKTLSLESNNLTDLPNTLEFCQNLLLLNITDNKFTCIPSVVLRLKNLAELKQSSKPLIQNHQKSIEVFNPNHKTDGTSGPLSLQSQCVPKVNLRHIEFWLQHSAHPKQFDTLGSSIFVCAICGTGVLQGKQQIYISVFI